MVAAGCGLRKEEEEEEEEEMEVCWAIRGCFM
jgi:hypothetical protein